MNKIFEDTTTAASAAKALDISRRTVNRYLADGRLEDGGLGPDGERRITLSSLTRLKGELDGVRRHVRAHDTGGDAGQEGADSLVIRAMAMLEEELRARRDEAERTREVLMIAERSTGELKAERDSLEVERDRLAEELKVAQEKADRARQVLAKVNEAGPFSRWKARRDAAQELANL